jgi:DNA-binding MarR family transcriptional regulator
MTEKQLAVYRFIQRFSEEMGNFPRYQEIGEEFGILNTAAGNLVTRLKDLGLVERVTSDAGCKYWRLVK